MLSRLCLAAVLLFGAACSSEDAESNNDFRRLPVIYGDDDRRTLDEVSALELPWVSDTAARAVALEQRVDAGSHISGGGIAGLANTTVAAVPDARTRQVFTTRVGGLNRSFGALAGTVQQRFATCPDERFADVVSNSECSGILVSQDVVLTAGHCFAENESCDRYLYRIAQEVDGESVTLRLACRELLLREVGTLSDGRPIDYALVTLAEAPPFELSRPRIPVDALVAADSVVTVGFPLGLPLIVELGGEVVSVDRTGFDLRADTYTGNSGSGVYDAHGQLVGVFSEGQSDFTWDEQRRCYKSRIVPAGQAEGAERAMHAWLAIERACFQKPHLSVCEEYSGQHDEAAMQAPEVMSERLSTRAGAFSRPALSSAHHEGLSVQNAERRESKHVVSGRAQCSTKQGLPQGGEAGTVLALMLLFVLRRQTIVSS